MCPKKKILIFTDLDGSLLDKETFKFDIIKDYFKELVRNGIIIIPNSSKTEAELLDFNEENNLDLSFIAENGSSIHRLNKIHQNLPDKIIISRTIDEIRNIYEENISLDFENKITHILELEREKQQKILGLPLDKIKLAIKRDHSIPIKFNGTESEKNEFTKILKNSGLTIQTGGRIMNVCDNVNKSKAMSRALQLIRKQLDDEIITIGVGDNENDIEMIKQTDYPCLVKNEDFDSSLINIDNLIKSDEPSPKGWSDVIKTALQKI